MEARIVFLVHKDFSKFLDLEDELEPSYDEALKELNKMLKDLVTNENLVFTYKGKPVKISLPLTIDDVGNIFSESENLEYPNPFWDEVQIPCKLRCKETNFNSDELLVENNPTWLEPVAIYY